MENSLIQNRIQEIIDWAKANENTISRRMVNDIVKEKNNDITDTELEKVIYTLEQKDIIITDTDEEDYYGYGKPGTPSLPADVNISMRNISLDAIVNRISHDEIDLNPDFQRRPDLWNIESKSRLIESLMLKIPVPSFYFDASNDSKWIVIDGLQRLSALKGFILDNSYKLTGLEYLTELEGLAFDELPRIYSRRILETQLALYTIEKGTPKKIVFNIFKRLNTGGLVLTSQEIRHALNQGEVIHLIKQMAECDEFKEVTEYSIKATRLQDCEYATRFLAFSYMDIAEYKGNIDEYLDAAMMKGNEMSQADRGKVLNEYKRTLSYCYKIFGRYAFRRVNDEGRRGPINKALFESFTRALNNRSDEELDKLVENEGAVKGRYVRFVSTIADFLKAGDKYTVSKRLQFVDEFIGELINDN